MAGVPLSINIPLLIADASDLVLGALLQPTWGIYLNGSPVILPASFSGQIGVVSSQGISAVATVAGAISDIAGLFGLSSGIGAILPSVASTVEFEFGQDFPISNYPQEQGAFQSYNKVTLPYDVKLKLASGGSVSARQAFLQTCFGIANSFALFQVVTPEITFPSVTCSHMDYRRTAERGNTLLQVDLYFEQVPVVSAVSFSSTQQPGESSQQGLGAVQSVTPSSSISQAFSQFPVT